MNWPLGKPRYGSYGWLLREIGDALEIGADSDSLDHEEFGRLESIAERGLRRFYAPEQLPGERNSHQWSFLFPVVQMSLVADTYAYDLPDGFEALTGPVAYDASQSVFRKTIEMTSERTIAMRRGIVAVSSAPTHAAIRVKEHDAEAGTRYELLFDPVPNSSYTVNVPVKIVPPMPTEPTEMLCGGDLHAETMRLACLAAANPEYHPAYMSRLAASVSNDRLANSADNLGRNADTSDEVWVYYRNATEQDAVEFI